VGIEFVSLVEPLTSVYLDVRGISVDSVWDSDGPLAFAQNSQHLAVLLQQPLNQGDTLTIWTSSGGSPDANFHWDMEYQGHISHYSEGMGPYSICHLFPCQDDITDKASFDGHFNVPDPYMALSCGELVAIESKDDRTITHWHHPQPISMYIWSVVISDFTAYSDTTYDWIKYYAYPDIVGDIQTVFGRVNEMIDCFEDLLINTHGARIWVFPS
jgi:hypothetical protein